MRTAGVYTADALLASKKSHFREKNLQIFAGRANSAVFRGGSGEENGQGIGVGGEPGFEFAQGFAAVGDAVLLFGRDFGHGAVVAIRDEEGVIPETAGATGGEGNLPLYGADEAGQFLAAAGHGYGAYVAGGEGFLAFRSGGQFCKHLAVVSFIIAVGAGVAGGVYAGHAAQGIHADAAVVRHHEAGEHGGDAFGLDGGVGGKGGAGLLRVRCAGEIGQGLQLELLRQNASEFACFVGVAGGDEERDAFVHECVAFSVYWSPFCGTPG